ncbi:MAG: sigma-70 family RNA polymerase sigma factor [Bosea sp. (in: a-proteobacteria)]|uniref:sigma-70 family RNA polymerase sigma factor n=2 Tax=Bosea TaxID=85413 RepID=UPI0009F4748C|nr:sigma-70 family RNA polymerase sigma factor [Bosea sp. (in: a-proteobacteria)]MDP3600221.1 sigma-70 family RNA polymerase sigma factor [Bosea sp. (in: a-proteobacteria)]
MFATSETASTTRPPAPAGVRRGSTSVPMDADALVQAIASSADRRAFAQLFEHFAPRVKGLLMRGGTPPDLAEELAQETLMTVWRKAALFDPAKAGASTWIATIARNLRIDHARREKRSRLSQVYEILEEEEGPEQPDAVLSGSERDSRVRVALKGLSKEQYRVVELAFLEGFSHQDVAQRLSIPLGTVKSRLRLAMAHLRRHLEDLR